VMNRPYKDGTTLRASSSSLSAGPWDAANGRLDPVSRVEDANDNGKRDGGEDKSGNGSLDGDCPVPATAGSAGPPWDMNQTFSPFDVDKNNRVENPVAATTVDTNFEYTKAQIYKHVITHEIGHAVGVVTETSDGTCIMNNISNNWSRDNHFSTGAIAVIRIHNK
jgi:hypothetical protein